MRISVQLRRFLIVGTTTVVVDLISYGGCLALGLDIDPAKAIGFIVGTLFAYLANRYWTFEAAALPARFKQFLLLYLGTLLANVAVNAVIVRALGEGTIGIGTGFVAATAVSASLNFLGMKFIVFRS